MSRVDVSAVLAIVDDGPDLEEILRQYATEFRDRGASYEFVLVLDGIGEERVATVRSRIPPGVPVRLVHFHQSFGEERALASGFEHAQGEILLSLPSYMQLDPGDVHLVLDALARDYDLVVGWRVPRVDPLVNRLQSWAYNRVMSALTGVRLHDMNSGLLAMRRAVAADVLVDGNVSRFVPVLAHRKGHRTGEVRVRHLRERGRTGFFGLGVYVRRLLDVVALLFITRFTRKPLRFFGMAGGISVLLGSLLCLWLLVEYLFGTSSQSDLSNRASLVIGVALIVLGVMTFSMGLVAEIIIFTASRDAREYTIDREWGPGVGLEDPRVEELSRPPERRGVDA